MKRTPAMLTVVTGGLLAAGWALDAHRRSRRARDTHRILVDLLLNALTADDAATARHSRRVADLSSVLGEACDLPRAELATLRVGALLHDVGKLDDRLWHIVHSDEKLEPREREAMQKHPDQSARILQPLEAIHAGISGVVASHHERWDGQGYPQGLAGEGIPLGARIIALADVFDALTQPRPYREPLDPEEALERLRESAGRQFDPRLIGLLDDECVREIWFELARDGLAKEEATPDDAKEMVTQSTK